MTVTEGTGKIGQQPKLEQNEMETVALRQLMEFWGAGMNEEQGRHALRIAKTATGNYNIEYAANWLLDQKSSGAAQSQQGSSSSTASASQHQSPVSSNVTPHSEKTPTKGFHSAPKIQNIDRGKPLPSEDTELQKAIALSLADQPQQSNQQQTPLGLGGQISAEEQELSKVIEASIAEHKKDAASHDLRQSSLFFVDPANPHERERLGSWPVGLKNIGNTCWFSVVMQALFHLPVFRRRLLNYDLDAALQKCHVAEAAASSSASVSNVTFPREAEFAVELRKLFALLLASRRKYVDPSGAVDVLRKQDSLQLRNIGGLDSGQQDVSEFTHLLLEWLEEAFKFASAAGSSTGVNGQMEESQDAEQRMDVDVTPRRDNPIEQLFYGTFITESSLNLIPPPAPNAESHAGDGGAEVQMVPTTKEERFSQYPLQVVGCETLHDSMEKSLCPEEESDVENWLERLPPVLLFELTRFQYNQVDKKPEKIHSKFRFPKVLYVDRYLRENKVAIREKRGYVSRLRQQLNTLKYELEKLENYRGSKMDLPNILDLTLDFIGRGDETKSSPREAEPMDGWESVGADATGDVMPQSFLRRLTDVTEAELAVMDRCLSRWREQVIRHVEELKNKIRQVEEQIESVYLEPCFQEHPYVLHAVLVHEGQATLGHYWTFINDRKTEKWLKFNDVQVTEVTFDEVERDSVGEYQSTSAYCLVYVDIQRSDLFEGVGALTDAQLVASLPPDLQQYVTDDNVKFATELSEWDRKHAAAAASALLAQSPGTPTADPRGAAQVETRDDGLVSIIDEHNRLCSREVLFYVRDWLNRNPAPAPSGVPVFEKLVEEKIATTMQKGEEFLRRLISDSSGAPPNWHACYDERVDHWLPFYAYCWMRCGGGKPEVPYNDTRVLRRIVLDYFANTILVGQHGSDATTTIYQMSKRTMSSLEWTNADQQIYARIYTDFLQYLQTLVLLAHAFEKLHEGAYLPALLGIKCAKNYAERLSTSSHGAGGVDFELVLACYRSVTMHFSEQTIKEVLSSNNDNEVVEKIRTMRSQLIPLLTELVQKYQDNATLETVRAGWFAAVVDENNSFSDVKQQQLRNFLDALMEVETLTLDERSLQAMSARIKLQADIGKRVQIALTRARELGILQCTHCVADTSSPAAGASSSGR